jgi:diadenosine tetraphosphate (Ap4A) HIT family hydrolase
MLDASCIFCKIISGSIPSYKIAESASALAFLDISPLSKAGHILVIPKAHAQFMHQVPEESLSGCILLAKKVATACFENSPYNLLQNNGREAHQFVDHCHFHLIPRSIANSEGLEMKWNALQLDQEALVKLHHQLSEKIKLHS